jgi:hypothetical protein
MSPPAGAQFRVVRRHRPPPESVVSVRRSCFGSWYRRGCRRNGPCVDRSRRDVHQPWSVLIVEVAVGLILIVIRGDWRMGALTVLDDIHIATPCQTSWDEMPGDDRVRSCPACSRAVYNIAAMTSNEVAALIADREGRLCARLFRRADGTVVTADCPGVAVEAPPTARPKSPYRRTHALVIILIALLLAWTANNTGESPPSGSGVTWDDWVHWAAVSLGLRPAPPPTPVFTPTPTMGDVAY